MKLCATIAEFNPFHNGHAHLIDSFKGNYDATVVIMSGNFVQRGAPAIFNKFSRADAAIKNGADLVIELPAVYALSSAETFASGAVKTLNASGSVDTLFFGSEEGSIGPLERVASLSMNESEDFSLALKEKLAEGMSYPKALDFVYKSLGIPESVISSPNNILGIEYIKALMKTGSLIKPATIERKGVGHDSATASDTIASASYLRTLISEGKSTLDYMPDFAFPAPVFEQQFSPLVLYALKTATQEDFLSVCDCTGELASRFLSAASASSLKEVIASVKSKNFTESRIRRILWNLVLKNNLSPHLDPTYIRILAQNRRGSQALSYMKKHSSIPVVCKCTEIKNDPIFILESRATDIYNIPLGIPSGADFRHSPIPKE